MANEQNLIPANKRSKSEARENGSKGGIASGVARRKKANLRKAFETILQAEVASPNVKKQLEELGFDSTNEMALAMVMMQKAMKGNVRAFEQISRLTAIDTKDSLDKREQKERIEALKLENQKRRVTLEGSANSEDVMAEYFDKLEVALNDGT